jgi:predicted membrane chloride channel (bestrophin family)
MINATGWSPVAVIFSWTGSALVNCWPQVVACSLIGILAALLKVELDVDFNITLEGHILAIFPVAFGLVFRTGMSYNRLRPTPLFALYSRLLTTGSSKAVATAANSCAALFCGSSN